MEDETVYLDDHGNSASQAQVPWDATADAKAWAKELKNLLSPGELQMHVRAQVTKMRRVYFPYTGNFKEGERPAILKADAEARDTLDGLLNGVLEAIYHHRFNDLDDAAKNELYQIAYTDLDAAYTAIRQGRNTQTYAEASELAVKTLTRLTAMLSWSGRMATSQAVAPVVKPRRTIALYGGRYEISLPTDGLFKWKLFWDTVWQLLLTPGVPSWQESRERALAGIDINTPSRKILAGRAIAAGNAATVAIAAADPTFPMLQATRLRTDDGEFAVYPTTETTQTVQALEKVWSRVNAAELDVEERYVLDATVADYLPESWRLLQEQALAGDAGRREAEKLFVEQVTLMTQRLTEIADRITASNLAASRAQSTFLRNKVTAGG